MQPPDVFGGGKITEIISMFYGVSLRASCGMWYERTMSDPTGDTVGAFLSCPSWIQLSGKVRDYASTFGLKKQLCACHTHDLTRKI